MLIKEGQAHGLRGIPFKCPAKVEPQFLSSVKWR